MNDCMLNGCMCIHGFEKESDSVSTIAVSKKKLKYESHFL